MQFHSMSTNLPPLLFMFVLLWATMYYTKYIKMNSLNLVLLLKNLLLQGQSLPPGTQPFLFFLSAFLRNFFLCQAGSLTQWWASTLGAALLCNSRAGSWFEAYMSHWIQSGIEPETFQSRVTCSAIWATVLRSGTNLLDTKNRNTQNNFSHFAL